MLVNKLKELRNGGDEEGFTLIELMIVVVIIGILAAIAIPIFANQQREAIRGTVASDVRNTVAQIITAMNSDKMTANIEGTATGGSNLNGELTLDDGTNIGDFTVIVSDELTTVHAFGEWDNYCVVGTNSGLEAGYEIVFHSASGQTNDDSSTCP